MADRTPIEWTDATWNVITGCTRVDEGCRNCYAEIMAARFSKPGQWGNGLARIVTANGKSDHRWTGKMRFNPRALDQPLRWRKPRRIFVNSTSDMFHDSVPDDWIDHVFAVMSLCPQHTFQVLTKRPERMRDYLAANPGIRIRTAMRQIDGPKPVFYMDWPLPNVWLGTSISDQASADARIPPLLEAPAAVRFLSAEPLLGPVDLTLDGLSCWPCQHCVDQSPDPETGIVECSKCDSTGKGVEIALNWVICGGESGPGARPMHPDWPRHIRDQCVAAGVAFFFKQWGEYLPAGQRHGITLGDDDAGAPIDIGSALRTGQAVAMDGLWTYRVGKKAAGRLLDGRTWDQMPGGTE